MQNTHSPFEPGYIGNADSGGLLVDDQPDFPGHRLSVAGLTEPDLERARADFDSLDRDTQAEFVAALHTVSDVELEEALADARADWARRDAYDALSDDDKRALEALSEEEQAALAGLSDEERDALTSAPATAGGTQLVSERGPELLTPGGDQGGVVTVPTGTVDDVLAWVGNDRGRAETALAVEETRSEPRKGVVGPLTQLLAQQPPSE